MNALEWAILTCPMEKLKPEEQVNLREVQQEVRNRVSRQRAERDAQLDRESMEWLEQHRP